MRLLFGEEILLISLDHEGVEQLAHSCEPMIAASVLLELANRSRVTFKGRFPVVTDASPCGSAVLDGVLSGLAGEPSSVDISTWIHRLQPQAVAATRAALVEKGLVHEKHTRLFKLLPVTRYPHADPTVKSELKLRITQVLVEDHRPDEHEAGLIVLLLAADMLPLVVDAPRLAMATSRAEALAASECGPVPAAATNALAQNALALFTAAVLPNLPGLR